MRSMQPSGISPPRAEDAPSDGVSCASPFRTGGADEAKSAAAVLSIDLAAVAANYRLLRGRLAPGAVCGAVLKADAYGLGATRVAPVLAAEGARSFFVAHLEEALSLRRILTSARIAVLNGAMPGTEPEFVRYDVLPVLNDLGAVERWSALARDLGRRLPALLQLDTGMARVGLTADEVARLAEQPDRLSGIKLTHIMSHYACADEPDHPLNGEQRARFDALRAQLPATPTSLANSAAIFLPPVYHGDLVRPGAALYGLNPRSNAPNPMNPAVTLHARILQLRDIPRGAPVGYGATYRAKRDTRVATLALGYADGYPWSLGNRGSVRIGSRRAPVIGRVSMDLVTVDVTEVPVEDCAPGSFAEVIGPDHPVDSVAAEAGTIGYEILTRLGHRFHRVYRTDST